MVSWQLDWCLQDGAHPKLFPVGMRGMPVGWKEKGQTEPVQGCRGGTQPWVMPNQIIGA